MKYKQKPIVIDKPTDSYVMSADGCWVLMLNHNDQLVKIGDHVRLGINTPEVGILEAATPPDRMTAGRVRVRRVLGEVGGARPAAEAEEFFPAVAGLRWVRVVHRLPMVPA